MSLPQFSPKRLREIADGTRNRDGSKKVTPEQVGAKQDAQRAKYVQAVTASEFRAMQAKPTRKVRSEKQRAKSRAWDQFSLFIRLRDSGPDGYGQCCTCQRNAHWSTMDAGHWITRAKEATLFEEEQVSLQCKGCNRFQGGKPLEHEQHIIRKYGPDAPQRIKDKAVQRCKRTLSDYLFIEKVYKERVELIRANDPGKWKV